jgi:hypothetical protein
MLGYKPQVMLIKAIQIPCDHELLAYILNHKIATKYFSHHKTMPFPMSSTFVASRFANGNLVDPLLIIVTTIV